MVLTLIMQRQRTEIETLNSAEELGGLSCLHLEHG
jgi:hypothetical protein